MKKSILSLAVLAGSQPLLAATDEVKFSEVALSWIFDNMVFVVAGLLLTGVVLALYSALNRVIISQTHDYLKEHGIAIPEKAEGGATFLQNLSEKMWALVPMDKESEINLNHDYDGIEELDNRLPPWWVYMFYITILWAGAYVYVFHFSDIGLSQQEEYDQEIAMAEDAKAAYLATQGNAVDESNVVMLADAASLSSGESIFKASCSACHGQLGEGGVGPNLTDPYWVHGGGIQNVFKTVKYGVPEKGMISWKAQLPPTAMQQVSSYILTLAGTDPPNGKEPEGSLWQEGTDALKAQVN
jgi:cytochrome c oxidase cbb3-type subunit 3